MTARETIQQPTPLFTDDAPWGWGEKPVTADDDVTKMVGYVVVSVIKPETKPLVRGVWE